MMPRVLMVQTSGQARCVVAPSREPMTDRAASFSSPSREALKSFNASLFAQWQLRVAADPGSELHPRDQQLGEASCKFQAQPRGGKGERLASNLLLIGVVANHAHSHRTNAPKRDGLDFCR